MIRGLKNRFSQLKQKVKELEINKENQHFLSHFQFYL